MYVKLARETCLNVLILKNLKQKRDVCVIDSSRTNFEPTERKVWMIGKKV